MRKHLGTIVSILLAAAISALLGAAMADAAIADLPEPSAIERPHRGPYRPRPPRPRPPRPPRPHR